MLNQTPLLRPQEITIADDDGAEHKYFISKVPAIPMREIVAKYPMSSMPRLGDYGVNQDVMMKLMSYAGVPLPTGMPLRLTTQELINAHVPDFMTLAKIEWEMLKYNWSFLRAGNPLDFLESRFRKALEYATKTLILSLRQSSEQAEPPTQT